MGQDPIVFEEVFVKEQQLLQKIKMSTDLTIDKILDSREDSLVGVHLFVLCHGFQGNSADMRLLKN